MMNKIDRIFNYDKYYDKSNDRIIYTDTDSIFISKRGMDISDIEKIVNDKAIDFSKIINACYLDNEDLRYMFKYECDIDTIVLYAKKMYFMIKKDNSVEIVGLEGKKESFNLAKNILKEIIDFFIDCKIKNIEINNKIGTKFINKLYYKYYNVIIEFGNLWKSAPEEIIKEIGFPVNISKEIENLKAISSYYRGVLIFDYFYKIKYGESFWENNLNTKGYHIYIKPNLDSFKKENLDLNIIQNEIFKKYLNVVKTYDLNSLTIPDIYTDNMEILSYFINLFDLDIDSYKDLIDQKISRLGCCLSKFCNKKRSNNIKYIILTNDKLYVEKNIFKDYSKSQNLSL